MRKIFRVELNIRKRKKICRVKYVKNVIMGRSRYERYTNVKLNKRQRSNERVQCHRTNSLPKGMQIVSKTKDPQICYIPNGSYRLAQCKPSCEEHAGSDKNLSKDIKIFSKIKGPQIPCTSHGSRGLAQCKSSCKNHASSDKLI